MRPRRRSRRALIEALEPRHLFASDSSLLVNILTPRVQTSNVVGSAIDVNDLGDSVIVFSGKGPKDDRGVFLRRFNDNSSSASQVIQVNQTTREDQTDPAVAIDDAGRLITVWYGRGRDPRGLSDQKGILGRYFDAKNQPITDEFLINTTLGGVQQFPDVSMARDGRSVVAWSGAGPDDADGVYFQLFNASGSTVGSQRRANIRTSGQQSHPSVAMADDGSFVVSWSSRHQDGDGWGIYYRLFHADGTPNGDERLATNSSIGSQFRSRIGIDAQGNFGIAWAGYSAQSSWDVYYRLFDKNGLPRFDQRQVNHNSHGLQQDADLSMASDGRFVISWSSGQPVGGGSSGWDVFAKLFDRDGNAQSDDLPIGPQGNSSGHQQFSSVAIGPGPIVTSWSGRGEADRGGVWMAQQSLGQRPLFPAVPAITTPEQQLLLLPLTTQPAYQGQRVGLRLDPTDHPIGMVIDPLLPRILWTPSESDGPGTFFATVIAYDIDEPTKTTSQRISIRVSEVNQAPILAAIPPIDIDELKSISFVASASDSDQPVNQLRYSLAASGPNEAIEPGMNIDPLTGQFTWTTSESHGRINPYTFRVVATDSGSPTLSTSTPVSIRVREVDAPPVLQPVLERTIDEGTSLQIQLDAIDPDDSLPQWRFLATTSMPTGMTLQGSQGLISWTPSESQGPGDYVVGIEALNLNQPSNSATRNVTIHVREKNSPPILQTIGDLATTVSKKITTQAFATDSDLPANSLIYSLIEKPDATATIDPQTGSIQWTPTSAGTYRFTVQVSDQASTPLLDRETFFVQVGSNPVSNPPRLPSIPDQVIDEQKAWTTTVTAQVGQAGQTIRYRLDQSPSGMTLNNITGQLTWTPNESQGPSLYTVRLSAFDQDHPDLIDSVQWNITVREVNLSPVINSLSNVTIVEGGLVDLTISASDSDLPANRISYSLVGPTPSGMQIDSVTGRLTWQTTEAIGPASFVIQVKATDDGSPSLSDTKSFTIEVLEENQAPLLDTIPDQSIDESTTWSYLPIARDTDLPKQTLKFKIDDASSAIGVAIDPNTGRMTWTPNEATGPISQMVVVSVSDNGSPIRSALRTFTIQVREVNQPPILAPIPNQTLAPGDTLSLQLQVTDPDLPQNGVSLTFSPALPSGAIWNAATNTLHWSVPTDAVSKTYSIRATATDDGTPRLSSFQDFSIEVVPKKVELIEADRFVTAYAQPIALLPGTRSLRFQLRDLQFDSQDQDSMNDALEIALLDQNDLPVTSVIAPGRDASFNQTEGEAPWLSRGALWNSQDRTVSIDVSHLSGGTQLKAIIRLVNNDQDDRTAVRFDAGVQQLTSSISDDLSTPPESAPIANVRSPWTTDQSLKQLRDLNLGAGLEYEVTSFSIEDDFLSSVVTLTNRSSIPMRGPLLFAINGIVDPDVDLLDQAGFLPLNPGLRSSSLPASLLGSPYYDLTPLLNQFSTSATASPVFPAKESIQFQLRFSNQSNRRFVYQTYLLGTLNQNPTVSDQPGFQPGSSSTITNIGSDISGDIKANDLEGGQVEFSIVSGPSGLTIHPDSGNWQWTPNGSQVGDHVVIIGVTDDFGATSTTEFHIQVLPPSSTNLPPRFTSIPIIDAYVGQPFKYRFTAIDGDQDDLQFTVIDGPKRASLSFDPLQANQGVLNWIPEAGDVEKSFTVILQADDREGGIATQKFQIAIHANPNNHPPIFVSTPSTTFTIPNLEVGSSVGPVQPLSLKEIIARGSSVTRQVSLEVPPDLTLPSSDIALVVDESGSMREQTWIADVVKRLDSELKQLGVYDNRYAVVGFGGLTAQPHILTTTPDFDILVYGPTGGLVQRIPLKNDGTPLQLSSPLPGKHTLAVVKHGQDESSGSTDGGTPTAVPFLNYLFESQSTGIQNVVASGFGLRSGFASSATELTFTAPASKRIYLDGISGGTIGFEILDPSGHVLSQGASLLADSGAILTTAPGTYRIRLTPAEPIDYAFRLVLIDDAAIPANMQQTIEGTLPDSEAATYYRYTVNKGDVLQIDRMFQASGSGNVPGGGVQELFTLDWVAPDGSVLHSPNKGNFLPSERPTLDVPPFQVQESGDYVLVVRKTPLASNAQIPYRFVVKNLANSSSVAVSGQILSGQTLLPSSSVSYAFDFDSDKLIQIDTLSRSGGEGVLRLIDAQGLTVWSSSMSIGRNVSDLPIRIAGRYWLLVEGVAANSQAVQFQIRLTSSSANFQPPPSSLSLAAGKWIQTSVNAENPATSYFIQLGAQETLMLQAEGTIGVVRVLAPSGGELFRRDFSKQRDAFSGPIAMKATTSGTYVIEFSATSSASFAFEFERPSLQPLPLGATIDDLLRPASSMASFEWNAIPGQAITLRRPDSHEPFADASLAASRALGLLANGGTEDGYQGLSYAIDNLPFRSNVPKHIVLLTDEDRDIVGGDSFSQIRNLLNQRGIALHTVVRSDLQLGSSSVLGLAKENDSYRGYVADGSGGFIQTKASLYSLQNAFGTTEQDYIDLALSNGGSNWSISPLRATDSILANANRESFTSSFVAEIASRVDRDVRLALRFSKQNAPVEIIDATLDSGRLTYDLSLRGDGDAWNFDAEFFDRKSNNIYGVVPIAIGAGYRYDPLAVDIDGDQIFYEMTSNLPSGASYDTLGGSLAWSPTSPGIYSFSVQATDDHGGRDTQDWNVQIQQNQAGNRSPQLSAIPSQTITKERPFQLQLEALDVDGDLLTFQLLSNPSSRVPQGMELHPATGTLNWTPSRFQLGSHPIQVRVVDGKGGSHIQSFTITVVPPLAVDNRKPIIQSQPGISVAARDRYRYQIKATDPDNESLRYTIATGPGGMIIDRQSGIVVWPTTDDDIGSHDVVLRVSDASGEVTLQAFQIFVTPSIPTRIISVPPNRHSLGTTFKYTLDAESRIANDSFNFELLDSPLGATLDRTSGLLQWNPAQTGNFSFEIKAISSTGEIDIQKFRLAVVDDRVNNPPTILNSPPTSIPALRQWAWQIDGSDPDMDLLQYRLVSGPAGMSITATGLVTWLPSLAQITPPQATPHSFRIEVSDGRGGSLARTFSLRVEENRVNHAPVLGGDPRTIAVAGRVYQTLFDATDEDNDWLIWSLIDAPPGMVIDSRGLVQWLPDGDDLGQHVVGVNVSDIYGASSQKTFALEVRSSNSPPSITSDPPVKHRRNTLYETTFLANDPEGDRIRWELLAGPNGATLDSASGKVRWTPTTNGQYDFKIAAIDPFGDYSDLRFRVQVDEVGYNLPPRFEATDPGTVDAGTRYVKRFPAADPDGDRITYAIAQGPAGMTIDAAGNVVWNAPTSESGKTQTIKLTATDTLGQKGTFEFRLPVLAANRAPQFDFTPAARTIAGSTYETWVQGIDPDLDRLEFRLISGPQGMKLDSKTGLLQWKTNASNIGQHPIEVSMTDNRIATPVIKRWNLEVVEDSEAPSIRIDLSTTEADVNTNVFVHLEANDDVEVASRELKIGNDTIDLNAYGDGIFRRSQPGIYTLVAKVMDASGNETTKSETIRVRDPNNAAPRIQFNSPNASQPITSPTEVLATVIDAERDLMRVALEIQRVDISGKPSNTWRTLNVISSTNGLPLTNLQNQSVGTLDPTSLANGNYLLRIVAEDKGLNRSVETLPITIDGGLKLGKFDVAFTDLSIPVAGIPIVISRVYDSFEADRQNDLGYGWRLQIAKARAAVVHDTLGAMGSGRYEGFVDGTRVLVTLPNGKTEGFTFRAQPGSQAVGIVFDWRPGFESDAGNSTRLELDPIVLIKFNDEYQTLDGVTYNPADPLIGGVYRLTTFSRLTHHIPADTGETVRISDRNDQSLIFQPDGIESTRGRSVTFERDYLGRIVRIVDPKGNAIQYNYSSDGDLVRVADRMNNATQYTYHVGLDHYLNESIDPFGNVAMQANYSGTSNRLASLADVDGNKTNFAYDLSTFTTTVTTPSGSSVSQQLDRFGNIIREVDRQGLETRVTYSTSAPFLPVEIQQVVGNPDTGSSGDDLRVKRQFNFRGQLVSQTDPRGNVTRYTYNASGDLVSTVSPEGIASYSQYDKKGNLLWAGSSASPSIQVRYDASGNPVEAMTAMIAGETGDFGGQGGHGGIGGNGGTNDSSSGVRAKFQFNSFGDFEAMTDHDGSVQTKDYDANGMLLKTSSLWRNPNDNKDQKFLDVLLEINANDIPASSSGPQGSQQVTYDALNRKTRVVDQFGMATEYVYDTRSRVIETRTESIRINAQGIDERIWLISQTVYDAEGTPLYASDPYLAGTPVSQRTATRATVDAMGRETRTERWQGIDIEIIGPVGKQNAVLKQPGTLVDFKETTYDSEGRVSRRVLLNGSVEETTYDVWSNTIESRVQTRDESGQLRWLVTRSLYDSLGRITFQTFPYVVPINAPQGQGNSPLVEGNRTYYNAQGKPERVVQVTQAIVTIQGKDITLSNPGTILSELRKFYDSSGRNYRTINDLGIQTDTLFDSRSRVVAVVEGRISSESIGLAEKYPNLWVRHRKEFSFNSLSQQTEETSGVIQVEDELGKVIAIDRTFARTTRFVFDSFGRVVETIFPDGSTNKKEFDSKGRTTATIDPLGQRTQFAFNDQGMNTSVSLPAVPLPNNPNQSVRPHWEYRYDAKGNILSIRDNLAEVTSNDIRADHDGKVGDDNRLTRFEYDAMGRLLRRILPDGSFEAFTYDIQGREATHTSFEGRVTRTIYSQLPASGSDVIRKEYFDSIQAWNQGNGTPSEKTEFSYDAYGRPVRSVQSILTSAGNWSDTGTWTTQYDLRGRIVRQTSPVGNINYEYDNLGRKTRMFTGKKGTLELDAAEPESDVRYSYDGLSRLAVIETRVRDGREVDTDVNANGAQFERSQYHYDILGRIVMLELPNGIIEKTEYNSMDAVSSISHWIGDSTNLDTSDNVLLDRFTYQYRIDGKRTGATETFTFDDDSNPATARISKTNRFNWSYDNAGRLIEESIDHADRTADRVDRFTWDLVGNKVQSKTDFTDPSLIDFAITHLYDSADHLLSETRDDGLNGSIDQRISYSWNASQQASKSTTDARGTQRQDFQFDARGRLSQVTNSSSSPSGATTSRTRVTYAYDPAGNRIRSEESSDRDLSTTTFELTVGNTTDYLVESNNQTGYAQTITEHTRDASGRDVKRVNFSFGRDELVQATSLFDPQTATWGSTIVLSFAHDAHQSVRALYDSAHQTSQAFSYLAYGKLLSIQGSRGDIVGISDRMENGIRSEKLESLALTSLLYSGESFDSRINLQYLRARWLGDSRFISSDPHPGLRSSPFTLNKYAYTSGNPIQFADPSGEFGGLIGIGISVGAFLLLNVATLSGAAVIDQFVNQPLSRVPREQIFAHMKYAMMAKGAYKVSEDDGTLGQIGRNHGYVARAKYIDPSTGYRSVLFLNPLNQDRKLSYAGTDDRPDVVTDIWQGMFGNGTQYDLAIDNANKVEQHFGKITDFTGHSLGGGLASFAAIVHNRSAITFNAAGVHTQTVEAYGTSLDSAESLILAYRVRGEFLSTIQNAGWSWLALGLITRNPGLLLYGLSGVIAPNGVGRAIWLRETSIDMFTRHKMSDVIAGMRKASS